MKDTGILFSRPMVDPTLSGRKTQTRRIVKAPRPWKRGVWREHGTEMPCWSQRWATVWDNGTWHTWNRQGHGGENAREKNVETAKAQAYLAAIRQGFATHPYGVAGDRLWGRETWRNHGGREYEYLEDQSQVIYRADLDAVTDAITEKTKWRPSIFMPRWASRISLELTGVRVERLNDISTADCWAEGVVPPVYKTPGNIGGDRSVWICYQELWDSLNEKRGYGWKNNPLVWVLEFRKVSR